MSVERRVALLPSSDSICTSIDYHCWVLLGGCGCGWDGIRVMAPVGDVERLSTSGIACALSSVTYHYSSRRDLADICWGFCYTITTWLQHGFFISFTTRNSTKIIRVHGTKFRVEIAASNIPSDSHIYWIHAFENWCGFFIPGDSTVNALVNLTSRQFST